MKTLYIRTTIDKYELPVAVADSINELAIMVGKKPRNVATYFSHNRRGWYKVSVKDDFLEK